MEEVKREEEEEEGRKRKRWRRKRSISLECRGLPGPGGGSKTLQVVSAVLQVEGVGGVRGELGVEQAPPSASLPGMRL